MFSLSPVYLASKSPRRRELLAQLGVEFMTLVLRECPGRAIDVDESVLPGETARNYVTRVCRLKADTGWQRLMQRKLTPRPVLAADTTVVLGERIFVKPTDAADAAAMLAALSGREHLVMTAVAVRLGERLETAVSETKVRFASIEPRDIDAYVRSGEPLDKAGAYAIQGHAQAFVESLHGSYSGVVGLPLYETLRLLRRISAVEILR